MIRSERRVEALELQAHLSNTALVHSALRRHMVDNQHVVNEDILLTRAFTRAGRTSRPIATVLLEGIARVSAYERHVWMKPGDVIAVDSQGAILMRQEGVPYMALALEWDPGPFGERGAPVVIYDGRAAMSTFRSVVEDVHGRRGSPRAPSRGSLAFSAISACPSTTSPSRCSKSPSWSTCKSSRMRSMPRSPRSANSR